MPNPAPQFTLARRLRFGRQQRVKSAQSQVAHEAAQRTKEDWRNAPDAGEMLEAAENAGIFHWYLEGLVYTPKTPKALQAVRSDAPGRILWARSRQIHVGPHSDWFWDIERSGGHTPVIASPPQAGAAISTFTPGHSQQAQKLESKTTSILYSEFGRSSK